MPTNPLRVERKVSSLLRSPQAVWRVTRKLFVETVAGLDLTGVSFAEDLSAVEKTVLYLIATRRFEKGGYLELSASIFSLRVLFDYSEEGDEELSLPPVELLVLPPEGLALTLTIGLSERDPTAIEMLRDLPRLPTLHVELRQGVDEAAQKEEDPACR